MKVMSWSQIFVTRTIVTRVTQATSFCMLNGLQKGTVSTGKTRPIDPMAAKQAHATHIGAEVVTSEYVAMKGAVSDAKRPTAMSNPLPRPRFSTLRACGVYLRYIIQHAMLHTGRLNTYA